MSPDPPSASIPLHNLFAFWARREVILRWLPWNGAVPDAICLLWTLTVTINISILLGKCRLRQSGDFTCHLTKHEGTSLWTPSPSGSKAPLVLLAQIRIPDSPSPGRALLAIHEMTSSFPILRCARVLLALPCSAWHDFKSWHLSSLNASQFAQIPLNMEDTEVDIDFQTRLMG